MEVRRKDGETSHPEVSTQVNYSFNAEARRPTEEPINIIAFFYCDWLVTCNQHRFLRIYLRLRASEFK